MKKQAELWVSHQSLADSSVHCYVDMLARALLFCQPPDWEDLREGPEERRPETLRYR